MSTLLLMSLAFADVVDEPPADCVRGAIGVSSHSGTWCSPWDCEDDDACYDGTTCREAIGLCVVTTEEPCGGMQSDTGECTFTKREVFGKCSEDADCQQGSCEVAPRCASGPVLANCQGCSSGPRGLASALVGLLVLGVLGRRRR